MTANCILKISILLTSKTYSQKINEIVSTFIVENLSGAMNEKGTTATSKFLSLVLRHQPQLIGIDWDEQGWVNVNELLEQANAYGHNLDLELLNHVVETNSKSVLHLMKAGKKFAPVKGIQLMLN